MSSIVPYVSDLPALRRAPAQMISTFTSINPLLRRCRSARAAMIKRPATPVRYATLAF
jgi:threonine/homoserine efflux transporter RhtA